MNWKCKRVWDEMSREEQGEIIENMRDEMEEQQRTREMSMHQRIERFLIEAITNGQCQAGGEIPSAEEIASAHDVSVATARRALQLLREKGLIVAVPGQALRVADQLSGFAAMGVSREKDRE